MQAVRRILGVQSSSEFHDHGLRMLVPDPTNIVELQGRQNIDLVFIHGLTGTWDGTWTGETTDGRKVLWPKELLRERFPTARIFSFSYDANAINLAHRVSTQSVTQHANDLLIELETVRRETRTQEHKLVFAVHSLGGLVVQKMLALSKNSYELHYQQIESLTVGVAFFGTPMLGADLAAWASIGTTLSSVLKQTNRDIVGVLEPNSSMAESIRLDIINLVATRAHTSRPIKIACFYECLPVAGYGKVVVNDKSATWPPHYQKGIQADHMNMTKFASTQARGYRDFIGEVGRWVDENICDRSQPSDLLSRLDFAERTARQQQIDNTDAMESTLDWIWSKEHESRSSFAKWLLNDQALFWIQGKPGSGKSTMMSYIEKASRSWQVGSPLGSRWNIVRFFFDFRAQSSLANNLEGFLRSLLFQILKQNPSSGNELHRLEERFGNYEADKWAGNTLKDAFIKVLLETSVNMCILVDGLDEFSGNMHELMTLFHKTPSKTRTGHLVKICLASRPHPVIELALVDRPSLQMQAHNTKAIEQYAFTTMEILGVAAYDTRRFSGGIAKISEGVFLWARFAVKEIIDGCAEGEDLRELNQRLEELPSDMEELYAHIFRGMNSRDHDEARIMFQLVCFAQVMSPNSFHSIQYLNLRQLKEAVAISQNDGSNSGRHNPVEELERFRKRLKAKSQGLLEEIFYEVGFETGAGAVRRSAQEHFKKNGGMIKLIHRTAESYLGREGWFLGLKSLQVASPQALWLQVCCKSIKSVLQPRELELRYVTPSRLTFDESTKSSLFQYASHNLFVHARLLEFQDQISSLPFLAIVSPMLWRYLREQYRLGFNEFHSICGTELLDWDAVNTRIDRQPWQIIVEQGLPLSLRDAALRHCYTPPSDGQDISIAILHSPDFGGYETHREKILTQQLLSNLINFGAIVSERNIKECVHADRDDLLEILLASFPSEKIRLRRRPLSLSNDLADVSSNHTKNHTSSEESIGVLWELALANFISHPEAMLVRFLNRGESLNEICGPGGTALHARIIMGHLDLAKPYEHDLVPMQIGKTQVFLKHGADANVSGPRGTPLQLAWRMFRSIPIANDLYSSGQRECISEQCEYLQRSMALLLDFGANPSWVEPNGISIDRHTIQAWCAMSVEEMKARWDEVDYPYCISDLDTYEFPLYRSALNLR